MAATRIYGGSNLSPLLQNDGVNCSSQSLDSFFISGSSPTFLGSRSMVSFEDVHRGKRSDRSLFHSFDQDENCDDEYDDYFHQPEKKRRLTSNQVQLLERSFELENKLEPEQKIQLAKDLGLQPRQVAIWFQNRRARWKTKQLEKDYETLQASYDSLKTGYDSLLREKDRLKTEVLHLTEKMRIKEKGIAKSELSTANKPFESPQQEPISDSASEEEISKLLPITACKQEDPSSVKSHELDLGSPHFADDGPSSLVVPNGSTVLERDQSDLSQDEEDNLRHDLLRSCIFPKLEDGDYDTHPPANSCNLGFLATEDHAFWSWSY